MKWYRVSVRLQRAHVSPSDAFAIFSLRQVSANHNVRDRHRRTRSMTGCQVGKTSTRRPLRSRTRHTPSCMTGRSKRGPNARARRAREGWEWMAPAPVSSDHLLEAQPLAQSRCGQVVRPFRDYRASSPDRAPAGDAWLLVFAFACNAVCGFCTFIGVF